MVDRINWSVATTGLDARQNSSCLGKIYTKIIDKDFLGAGLEVKGSKHAQSICTNQGSYHYLQCNILLKELVRIISVHIYATVPAYPSLVHQFLPRSSQQKVGDQREVVVQQRLSSVFTSSFLQSSSVN